jgi:predicted SprT family Zn-dependent metalloprotease
MSESLWQYLLQQTPALVVSWVFSYVMFQHFKSQIAHKDNEIRQLFEEVIDLHKQTVETNSRLAIAIETMLKQLKNR